MAGLHHFPQRCLMNCIQQIWLKSTVADSNAAIIEENHGPAIVSKNRIGSMTHLYPRGDLTEHDQLEALDTAVTQSLENREVQLIIDLVSVMLINSKTLELLFDLRQKLAKAGGWIKLTNAKPLIRDIFRITAIDQSIEVIDSLDVDNAQQVQPSRATADPIRMGDLLVSKGLLSEKQVEQAITLQKTTGRRLGQIIVDKGWVEEEVFLTTLGEQLSIPYVTMRQGLVDTAVFEKLDISISQRLKVVPMFLVHGELTLATSDPQAMAVFSEIEDRMNCKVRPVLVRKNDIIKTLNESGSDNIYGANLIEDLDDDFEFIDGAPVDDQTRIDEMAAGSPVINMVNSIIQRAVHDQASDIHIEPSQKKCRVRFRIDGLLYEVMTPRIDLHPALVSRLKVMANLDIAERRMPQDGRIQVHTHGRSVDLRFSSLPGMHGEKVVLRVLDKNQSILDIDKLGMQDNNVQRYKRLLDRSFGLILVTGPTGSGKTTSLYSAINYLNSLEKNIVTIEDPVEYQLDIVNQNAVKENIGLTFAKMLKHVLRQDPDIVMVGEIRERETAEIAVQAALTGHLVLSTLHTNDGIGAVTRMIDMGVEPYLLSSALIGVVAQRLVRSVCPNCRTEFLAGPEIVEQYGWQDKGNVRLSKGRGCAECYDSGYRGRMGIHEIIEANPELQRLIVANASRDELTEYLQQHKIELLFDDGMDRVLEGRTTVEEILRVVNS
jgi:type IV pilus assembly protein PilB